MSVCVLRAAIPLAEVVFERSVAFQCEARRFLLDDDDDGQRKIRPDRRGWCVKCLSLLWGSNLWKTFGVPGGKKNECLCPVPVAVRNRRPVEVHVSFRRGQITLRRRFERKNGSAREKKEKVTRKQRDLATVESVRPRFVRPTRTVEPFVGNNVVVFFFRFQGSLRVTFPIFSPK